MFPLHTLCLLTLMILLIPSYSQTTTDNPSESPSVSTISPTTAPSQNPTVFTPPCAYDDTNSTYVCVCDERDQCKGRTITCADDVDCRMECTAYAACHSLTLTCTNNTNCSLYCGAVSACYGANIQWPSTPTGTITCDGNRQTCHNVNFPIPPPYQDFVFDCNKEGECSRADIYCPEYADCNIICSAKQACQDAIIHWSTNDVQSILNCTYALDETECLRTNLPPTTAPSSAPTLSPTSPTAIPTQNPSEPTAVPTMPSTSPSAIPTEHPSTIQPSMNPTLIPTESPTTPIPTKTPTLFTGSPTTTAMPTGSPSVIPTGSPTKHPTSMPTKHPTMPTHNPSVIPTGSPTENPIRFTDTVCGYDAATNSTVCVCNQPNQCEEKTIVCAYGADCSVECSDESSCRKVNILCPANAVCNVNCDYYAVCHSATIDCTESTDCILNCPTTAACYAAHLYWPSSGTGTITSCGGYRHSCNGVKFPTPPPYDDFTLDCDAEGECSNAEIYCPEYAKCHIICSGDKSCRNAYIHWSANNVESTLSCTYGDVECEGVNLPPTREPTMPSTAPTTLPTSVTGIPTAPSSAPTVSSGNPTSTPSKYPSETPTKHPTATPTAPSVIPTEYPSIIPTVLSETPTEHPIVEPTGYPSEHPTTVSGTPTTAPTTAIPTEYPSIIPTVSSETPTEHPTVAPTEMPTLMPSEPPTLPRSGQVDIRISTTIEPIVTISDNISSNRDPKTSESISWVPVVIILGCVSGVVVLFAVMFKCYVRRKKNEIQIRRLTASVVQDNNAEFSDPEGYIVSDGAVVSNTEEDVKTPSVELENDNIVTLGYNETNK